MLALVLVLSMVAALFVGAVGAAGNDLSGHWAEKKITSWIDRGLINGYSDGSFRPDGQITRGEFCAIVNRVFGFDQATGISFTDVYASHWAYDDVTVAVGTGYMTGMGDGTFGVDKPISRQEMAVVIARLLGLSAVSGNGGYSDAASFASWAAGSIAALAEEGVMNGYPDGTFRPQRSVTRAEAVSALDQMVDEEGGLLLDFADLLPKFDDDEEDDDDNKYDDDDDDDDWTGGGSGGIGGGDDVDDNTSTRPDPNPDSADKSPIAAPKPPADAPYSDFIVYEGVPQAHIMLMEDATGLEKQAADELQAHVELVSGVTLPIDTMDPADFDFSASYAPGVVSTPEKGYYPVEITLRNPSSEAMVVTLETAADGEAEPTITVRGDEGDNTAVTVQANSQVRVSAMVTVENAESFGMCDIDLQVKEGGEVLDTLSIEVAGLGNNVSDGGFETADNSWTGGEASNLTAKTGAASYKFSSEAVMNKALPLRSGGLYYLSFYAKAEAENTTVYGKVTDLDADGDVLDVPMSLYSRAAVKKGVWTYVEMTFTANSAADAAYAASQLSLVAEGGNIWVDDVKLVDCGSTPVNTLSGDFEEYDPDGGNNKFKDWFTHTVMTNETNDVYAGEQAGKLPNWGGMLGMGSLTGTATTPDVTYTFSFWMKATSGSGSFTWQWQPVIDGYTQPATATTLQISDQWERYTIKFHTPVEEPGHLFNGCYFNFKWTGDLLMDHAMMEITDAAEGLTPPADKLSTAVYDFADGLQGWTGATADSSTGCDALGAMKVSADGEASYGSKLQLTPDNLYSLSFWAKAATKDAVLYAKVSDFNASGAALTTPMSAYNRMDVASGNWTYHEIRFVANTSGDIAYADSVLSLVNASVGEIWIDDVTVVDAATSPDIEKDNPDFETYTGDGGSTEFPGYFFHTVDSLETADVYTGEQAAKLASSGHNLAFYGIHGNDFLFEQPGQTYTFSVWMKSATPGAWVNFSTSEYVNNVHNGHTESHEFKLTDQWERYEFTYETAPKTYDVWKFNGSYMNFKYSGDILFDNCTLYVSTPVSNLELGASEDEGEGEQEAPIGAMPALDAPVPSGMTIIIATTDSYPELDSYFPDDVDYLGDSDGFAVRQRGGAVYIFGTKPKGTLNGAYDFIEKNLGVIWFRADDTAFDPMSTIDPAYTDYVEKSPFEIRGWHLCGIGDKGQSHSDPDTEIMMTRNKLNAKMAEEGNWTLWPWQRSIGISSYTMGHNVGILMRSSSLYDPEDDEFYPTDKDGNRHPQAGSDAHCEVNYFSDKVAAAVLDGLIKKIEANPEITHIGVGQNDSSNYYVKGKSDQPFEYAPGQFVYPGDQNYMSTVLFTFINKIAEPIKELYPHITLTTYAYNWSTPAPAMDVCDNVQILYCDTSENLKRPFHESYPGDPNYPIYTDLMGWMERDANIVVYNYFGCSLAAALYARPIYETIQKDLQFYAENRFAGVLPEGVTDAATDAPGWAMNHMTYWLYHKLSWNPYIDLDAEVEYFCNKVYGPEAGPYMLDYYRVLKDCFDNTDFDIHYTTRMPDYLNNFILNQGLKQIEMQEAITNAYKAAEGVYKDRIKYIYDSYNDVVAASSTLQIQEASAKYTEADKSVILNTTDFSDPIWSDTKVLDNFYHNQWLRPVTGAHTQVRLLWDEEYLYVGYEMFDDTIGNIMTSGTYADSTKSWWNSKSDDVETYLTMDSTLNDYYAYFVNPSDLNFRYKMESGYRRHDASVVDWTFNSEIINAEGTENDKWVVIKAISWGSLGLKSAATADTEVYGYFYREFHNESAESNQIAWNGAGVWSNKSLRPIELLP